MTRPSAENTNTLLKFSVVVININVFPNLIEPNFILSIIYKTTGSFKYEWLIIDEYC